VLALPPLVEVDQLLPPDEAVRGGVPQYAG
jgi:hypothetical protein